MGKVTLFMLIMGMGCSNRVIYSGNSLVIVEPDAELEAFQGNNIRLGIRFWDDLVLPQFRTIDQLPPELSIQDVPVLKMHASSGKCNIGAPLKNETIAACYRYEEGDILIDLDVLTSPIYDHGDVFRQDIFAHEIGHAMGLQHISGCVAIMSPGCIKESITDADRGEYYRLWAGR